MIAGTGGARGAAGKGAVAKYKVRRYGESSLFYINVLLVSEKYMIGALTT